jgi:nucleoside-diphosphate-sugar epimerase
MRGLGSLAVFGVGYCGRALLDKARRRKVTTHAYSANTLVEEGARFDSRQPRAVEAFDRSVADGAYDAAVVTFPPEGTAPAFWEVLARKARRMVLLGTTGIYRREGAGRPVLTESTPLVADHPRAAAETELADRGGVVLRLAGIYGAGRNPGRWVREGRLVYEDRQLNLVHVEDICRAVLFLTVHPHPDPVYNLSDGQVHTARDLIDLLVDRAALEHPRTPVNGTRPDAFVSNQAFQEAAPGFAFQDFEKAILALNA